MSNELREQKSSSSPIKVTLLLELKDALIKEEYERCPEIIGLLKEYGVQDQELRFLLEDPRRTPT